jgi:hypothetical protein
MINQINTKIRPVETSRQLVNKYYPARLRKNGATQLDPQHHEYFPSPVPRASYVPATLQLPETQLSC